MLNKLEDHLSCPLNYTMSLLSGKWKPFIIWYLSAAERPLRYGELKRSIPYNLSDKVLIDQLNDLIDKGVIIRTQIDEENPNVKHVEYRLSEKGLSLCNIVFLLRDWGSYYGSDESLRPGFMNSRGTMTGVNKLLYVASSHTKHIDLSTAYDSDELLLWSFPHRGSIN